MEAELTTLPVVSRAQVRALHCGGVVRRAYDVQFEGSGPRKVALVKKYVVYSSTADLLK